MHLRVGLRIATVSESRFRLSSASLPDVATHWRTMANAATCAAVESHRHATAGRKVLVVALTQDERSIVRECRRSFPFELGEVLSVDDALRQDLQSAPVVLCSTDGRPGWRKSLTQLLSHWPGARVIFISRLCDERMWVDMLEAGAYDLLPKPLSAIDLSWILRGALLNGLMVSAAFR